VTGPAAITLARVGKRYIKYEDTPMLVTRVLRVTSRTRRSQLWALRDVDLAVDTGECLGVIGRNGSGKSTMLRLLAGVTAPTEGSVAVRGNVAPLIAVGVGFHPELTGRENVYVNGTILGLSRHEIDHRFDEIVDFAGIEDFIDTPVKFYSSGMLVRLGFSVAVTADPDVLLVDEVLAVGDIAFQLKCFNRMMAVREQGTTIVVVSHNLNAVRNLCPRTIVLHEGTVRYDGDTVGAISLYHDLLGDGVAGDARAGRSHPTGAAGAVVESFELIGPDGAPTKHVDSSTDVTFRARIRFLQNAESPIFGVSIHTEAGVQAYGDSTPWAAQRAFAAGTSVVFDARLRPALATGSYTAYCGVRAADGVTELAPPAKTILFYVAGRSRVNGVADLGASLRIEPLTVDIDEGGVS